MEISMFEFAVLPGGNHALSLDTKTTWPPQQVTGHVTVRVLVGTAGLDVTWLVGVSTYLQHEK